MTVATRLGSMAEGLILLAIIVAAAVQAYRIRLYAIENYGRLIHEVSSRHFCYCAAMTACCNRKCDALALVGSIIDSHTCLAKQRF